MGGQTIFVSSHVNFDCSKNFLSNIFISPDLGGNERAQAGQRLISDSMIDGVGGGLNAMLSDYLM